MKKIIFLFWLILGALSLSSCTEEEEITQGDIVGVVTDAANGTQPLSGVQVSILPNGASTSTGSDGKFSFPKLEAGEYKIQFMKEGYETNTKSVTVVPGQVSNADMQLIAVKQDALIQITPSTLNFGTTQTELSVKIQNNGNTSTDWSLDLGSHTWITANPALGMDHVKELGPTLADIAAAKAGIIKPGCPVVSYGGAPEADAVLRRVAAQQHASFTEVDFAKLQVTGGDLDAVTFSFDGLDGVRLPLIGSYQPRNAALAITALRVLRQQGWNIPESAIRTGLEQVSWPGRFELLRHSPAFVLDGSHNAHGMRATVQSLKDRFPGQKFVFLVSIMADKDVDEMLALLAPLAERFVTVTAHNPRAMPAQTLAEHIRAYGCTAEAADSIEAGVARAEELGGEGPVCALGTLYFSGDVRQAFAKINKA